MRRALEEYWGRERHRAWLGRSASGERVAALEEADLGPTKFPSIKERLMDRTTPETIQQYLRDLGSRLHKPTQIIVDQTED